MAYEFQLPDLGEGVAEGEVMKWRVAEGDTVVEDQPLVEVMTDKATVEIPSPRAGRVARLGAAEGETIPVGHVLVVIDEEGGGAGEQPEAAPESEPATEAVGAGREGGSEDAPPPSVAPAFREAAGLLRAVEATPAVRTLARELQVDLRQVQGTGPRGRIVAGDVRRAAGGEAPAPVSAPAATAEDEERLPLRGLRKRVSDAMTRSHRVVPQFTFVAEADVTAVAADRDRRKPAAAAAGVKLTFVAYVARALAQTLPAHPWLNASLDEDRNEIVVKKRLHLAVAVATAEGLTVPVVRDAGEKELLGLAREIERLAEAARANRLEPEELSGATFTLTTTGARGGLLATPIVHHPQVAILGVHAIGEKPVVRDGEIVIRRMVNLSLSMDHRVVDGQVGADFLYDLIERLEAVDGGDHAE